MPLIQTDGEELWGYIPPNIIGKLSTMVTSKANASNAIYGIDGSATVKDIYFDDTPGDNIDNPRWRTILVSASRCWRTRLLCIRYY